MWSVRLYSEDARSEVVELKAGSKTTASEFGQEIARALELPQSKWRELRIMVRAPLEQRIRSNSFIDQVRDSSASKSQGVDLNERVSLGQLIQTHGDFVLSQVQGLEPRATIVVRNAAELGDRLIYASLRQLETLQVRMKMDPTIRVSIEAMAGLIDHCLQGSRDFDDSTIQKKVRQGGLTELLTSIGFIWKNERFELTETKHELALRVLERLETLVGPVQRPHARVVAPQPDQSNRNTSSSVAKAPNPYPGLKPLRTIKSEAAKQFAETDYSSTVFIIFAVAIGAIFVAVMYT
jgi:hypothetical protein